MNEIATYTFLPWLREGIANQISGQSGSRATIPIDLIIKGKKVDGNGDETVTVPQNVEIYGPGDVTGIDKKAIIKAEPRNWITNFEPNYMPYIEFYDEGLPWRYSPMPNPASGDHRLQPWLALVVLKVEEFKNGKNIKDKPLPYIQLTAETELHDASQLWAWAHVHVNQSLIGEEIKSENSNNISSKLQEVVDDNPDMAYSRILCPRKLEENVAYHAFLVPAFESGRLAGLGEDPTTAAFNTMAWDIAAGVSNRQLPYYHRWYFRTGSIGDFEYLVRLLEPKPVDSRVGKRDMDVQQPGANLLGLRDDPAEAEKLNGILKLGGALRIPDIFYAPEELAEVEKYRNWATLNNTTPYPHPFQNNIASFINLTDSYEVEDAGTANSTSGIEQETDADNPSTEYDINSNPDPLITAPLYGRWHALTQRLLKKRDNTTNVSNNDNWVHELNLDPRWRVAAGFGTKVVQENQENYMKAAWEQVGEVLEANKKIREAQLAKATSRVWYETHLLPMKEKKAGKWLSVAAPVHKRVVSEGVTVYYQKKESRLTTAATSVNMRKLLRPRGKFARRLAFDETIRPDNLITRINDGEVTAAAPKETPEGIQTSADIADTIKPDIPDFIVDLLERYPWLKWIPLLLALLILLFLILFPPAAVLMAVFGAIIAALVYLYRLLNNWGKQIAAVESVLDENQTPEAVDDLPTSSDFRISEPGDGFTPSTGGQDSDEAVRFKEALKDVNRMILESAELGKVEERPPLNIAQVNEAVFENINPELTIPRWIFDSVKLPPFIILQLKEQFTEAMAYPKFDLPMYKPLVNYSSELFLPNINFIEQNSISILETNQKFIESYLVGLNHEFARELLWREYPTDQRGSYFRQFWEVSGFLDTQPLEIEALKTRFETILTDRIFPELQECYDQLVDPDGPRDEAFLEKARYHLLKEELKDIKPLHYWSKSSELGDHDNRELPGENEEEVVLVIRGELLKKYPTAVIYAHKAEWNYKKDDDENFILDDDGNKIIDLTKERTLAVIPAGQEDNPPPTIIKSPLYQAKVDPDIYFFGFDLTVCEAKGGTGDINEPVDDRCKGDVERLDAGWFFVIKERPGEPRFGLDVPDPEVGVNQVKIWNDLSWSHVTPAVPDGGFLQISNATLPVNLQALATDHTEDEKIQQKGEDEVVDWDKDMSAADLAYILYQVPVLVAVHACEMLPDVPTI